jgi:hypothetical protein
MTGATTAPADLADASRRLLEQSFNTSNFDLIDQLVAPEALNHDPALPLRCATCAAPTRSSA